MWTSVTKVLHKWVHSLCTRSMKHYRDMGNGHSSAILSILFLYSPSALSLETDPGSCVVDACIACSHELLGCTLSAAKRPGEPSWTGADDKIYASETMDTSRHGNHGFVWSTNQAAYVQTCLLLGYNLVCRHWTLCKEEGVLSQNTAGSSALNINIVQIWYSVPERHRPCEFVHIDR